MTDRPGTEPKHGLQRYFDAARAEVPEPTGALLARIEAQALAEQAPLAAARVSRQSGVLGALTRALGGWPAMAGLAAAALTGVWLGFAPPEAVLALWPGEAALTALDPISGYDFAFLEG